MIRSRLAAVGILYILMCAVSAFGIIEPNQVVILVNSNSPTSRYIAKLYREYYPDIPADQVLELSNKGQLTLPDCSGPYATAADEIITRQQYEQLIAQPLRDYLADPNYPERLTRIRVIVTTAGLPYRIEDTNPSFADAVYEAGGGYHTIINNEYNIDAASVESELSSLWYLNDFGIDNRMVNPYQGCRGTGIDCFEKADPASKTMNWTWAYSLINGTDSPKMEGAKYWYGTNNRNFGPGDIYLVCRLDGPKKQGSSAVFAVRKMLERSRLVSDKDFGINPQQAAVLIDDAPNISVGNINRNRTFNVPYGMEYWQGSPEQQTPPDSYIPRVVDDYDSSYLQTTLLGDPDYALNIGFISAANDIPVLYDARDNQNICASVFYDICIADEALSSLQGLVFYSSFGVNGDENRNCNYMICDGTLSFAPLFNGAVFTSLESYNAATMFSDVDTHPWPQGKIVDFIQAGGSAAIGHIFEPQTDAAIDNEFLLYNYLSDEDEDGYADLTFAEAAFTALPYLSWAEVVIGDPLMRIAYGPGKMAWQPLKGDVNNDNRVNYLDIWTLKAYFGGVLQSTNNIIFDKYDDRCDVNQDGKVNYYDIWITKANFGSIK